MFPKPIREERVRKPLQSRTPLKAKTRLKPEKKKLLPRSKNPRKTAKNRAWDAFSLWVRLSNADINGMVKCFTCDKVAHYKEMDAGHFIHRDALDFNEYNVNVQCTSCNRYLSGNGVEYAVRMMRLYGVEVVEELMRLKNIPISYGIGELLEIEKKYKEKINGLA
jgi:hypothetical protein